MPGFSKKKVKPLVTKTVELARAILVNDQARDDFGTVVASKRQWHVRGFGRSAKKRGFKEWYAKRIQSHNCVYVFWSGRRCEYVGRTIRGRGRPSSQFDKFWFTGVTRLDIYSVVGPGSVPKAECLAIHLFDPRRNVNSASKPKYARRCPICHSEKRIKKELARIFPLRRKRRKAHR